MSDEGGTGTPESSDAAEREWVASVTDEEPDVEDGLNESAGAVPGGDGAGLQERFQRLVRVEDGEDRRRS